MEKTYDDISDYRVVYFLLKSFNRKGGNLFPDELKKRLPLIISKMNKKLQDGGDPEL